MKKCLVDANDGGSGASALHITASANILSVIRLRRVGGPSGSTSL